MTFGNPILGGQGTLIRNAIKSPNYVPGVSGWSINKDGSAEFNDLVVRGSIIVNSSNGSSVQILANDGGRIVFYPPTMTGITINDPASIYSNNSGALPTVNNFLILSSAEINGANQGQLFIGSRFTDGSAYPGFIEPDALVETNCSFQAGGDLLVGDGSNGNHLMGAGHVTGASNAGSSAAIGVTETVVLTAPSYDFREGRAYKVTIGGLATCSGTVPSDAPNWRVRKTNTAGQVLGIGRSVHATNSQTGLHIVSYFKVGAGGVTASLVATAIGDASHNATHIGNGTQPRYFMVEDVGDANGAQYANVPTLV